jgi:hypothetical protein
VEVSKFLDHGTANPIVARLTSQTFAILDACNLSKEAADKIKVVYMQALTKTLVWCGEIAMRYQGEFVKQAGGLQAPAAERDSHGPIHNRASRKSAGIFSTKRKTLSGTR